MIKFLQSWNQLSFKDKFMPTGENGISYNGISYIGSRNNKQFHQKIINCLEQYGHEIIK